MTSTLCLSLAGILRELSFLPFYTLTPSLICLGQTASKLFPTEVPSSSVENSTVLSSILQEDFKMCHQQSSGLVARLTTFLSI